MPTRDDENDEPATETPDPIKAETIAAAGLGFEWGPYDRPLPSDVNPAVDPGDHEQPETD